MGWGVSDAISTNSAASWRIGTSAHILRSLDPTVAAAYDVGHGDLANCYENNGMSAQGLQRVLGFGSYQTVLTIARAAPMDIVGPTKTPTTPLMRTECRGTCRPGLLPLKRWV